jgi:alkyl sulfatase BDS1-like metallo-beta-lactamase superfamily hydrolase
MEEYRMSANFVALPLSGLEAPLSEMEVAIQDNVHRFAVDVMRPQIENAVLHFRKAAPDKDANATLTLTKAFFLQMMAGQAGAKDLLLSDQTKIEGSKIDLGRFFSMIEKAPGTFPIVTR